MADKENQLATTTTTDMKPKQKRNRPDLAKFGQENCEPGDNSRFLRHALATMSLPPIDISDARQVEERIEWYFRHCLDNDMKPTATGFCNSLGVHKDTIRSWYHGEFRANTHQAIIKRAYSVLEELWDDYMLNGKINPVSGIFLGKNQFMGYQDKQELVLTPNTGGISAIDPQQLEAKYDELPED